MSLEHSPFPSSQVACSRRRIFAAALLLSFSTLSSLALSQEKLPASVASPGVSHKVTTKPNPASESAAQALEIQPTARAGMHSPSKSDTFGDWVLTCQRSGGIQNCALHQRLADSKNRKIIAFKAASHAAAPYLEVSAPLGLSIPYGVALVLPDNTEFAMELADCEANGCRAVVPLEAATLKKLKSASKLGVRFQDSKSGKVITIKGSLTGFTQGIAALLRAG